MKKTIHESMLLRELVGDYPETMELLHDLHIDYCCHGGDTIEEAAKKEKINAGYLVERLKEVRPIESSYDLDDFKGLDQRAQIREIELGHHERERKLLQEIDDLLQKILKVHYAHHSDTLLPIHSLFGRIKTALEAHLIKEEAHSFPLFGQDQQETLGMISVLEEEHQEMGDLVRELQELTDFFSLPDDACKSYERTFSLLKELTEDIFLHIFKENSILFQDVKNQA